MNRINDQNRDDALNYIMKVMLGQGRTALEIETPVRLDYTRVGASPQSWRRGLRYATIAVLLVLRTGLHPKESLSE